MIHAEPLCLNPITGRRVWILRDIEGDKYGQPWRASLIVVRKHWAGKTAHLVGGEHIDNVSIGHKIRGCLVDMGFFDAVATRHGRTKHYRVKTRSSD